MTKDSSPIRAADDLKGRIARLDTRIEALEGQRARAKPGELPELLAEIADLSERRAELALSLAGAMVVLNEQQAKFEAERERTINEMPGIMKEVAQATTRFNRALDDLAAAVRARNDGLKKLEPLAGEFVEGWVRARNYTDALETSLYQPLGLSKPGSSFRGLQDQDALVRSSCEGEIARLRNLKKVA